MQRLSQFEHHVVGRVDHVVQRAHPAQLQPPAHPERRGPDLDSANRQRRVARAQLGREYLDPSASPRAAPPSAALAPAWQLRGLDGRLLELQSEQRRDLARQAQDRQAIAAIGRDRDIEHGVVETADRAPARLPAARRPAAPRFPRDRPKSPARAPSTASPPSARRG